MGQKIHPTGFRLGVKRKYKSNWFAAKDAVFADLLLKDISVREYLEEELNVKKKASVSRVEIERPAKNARITIHTARRGVVIGRKGDDIETLKLELQKRMGVPVHLEIEEVSVPEIDAQLISDSIAQQLKRRAAFRRAMKRAMQNAIRFGARGIKIQCSGRLNGIEIARTEWYLEGSMSLHSLSQDIDWGHSVAHTQYGAIGITVWVSKGDSSSQAEAALGDASEEKRPRRNARSDDDRRRNRAGDGGDRSARPGPGKPGASDKRGRG